MSRLMRFAACVRPAAPKRSNGGPLLGVLHCMSTCMAAMLAVDRAAERSPDRLSCRWRVRRPRQHIVPQLRVSRRRTDHGRVQRSDYEL